MESGTVDGEELQLDLPFLVPILIFLGLSDDMDNVRILLLEK